MKGQPLKRPTGVETSVQIAMQVPVSMRERMRKATATHKDLNWTQVVRDAIEAKLKSLSENNDASKGN